MQRLERENGSLREQLTADGDARLRGGREGALRRSPFMRLVGSLAITSRTGARVDVARESTALSVAGRIGSAFSHSLRTFLAKLREVV